MVSLETVGHGRQGYQKGNGLSVRSHPLLTMAHQVYRSPFDLVFSDGLATHNDFLLLIKLCPCSRRIYVYLFECGKHDNALSHVDDLIDIANDQSLYITVRVCQYECGISSKQD